MDIKSVFEPLNRHKMQLKCLSNMNRDPTCEQDAFSNLAIVSTHLNSLLDGKP